MNKQTDRQTNFTDLYMTVLKSPCTNIYHRCEFRPFFKVFLYGISYHFSGPKLCYEFIKRKKNTKMRIYKRFLPSTTFLHTRTSHVWERNIIFWCVCIFQDNLSSSNNWEVSLGSFES